jgi:hypothetical protein
MGCSSSKKESPLDPSDVQLSGGEPLSQLSGVSRSEQRQSSAANLDPRRHMPTGTSLKDLKALRSGSEPAGLCSPKEKEAIRRTASERSRDRGDGDEGTGRLFGSVNELIFAAASDIALGLEELLGHSKAELSALWMDPLAAIEKEFAEHGTAEDKVVVDYVLHKKAGSCDVEFSNGGKMDQGQASDYQLTLAQFTAHPGAKKAKLEAYHVAGLRIYSTAAYKSINTKLRKRINDKSEKYPFPITVLAIKEAIMKLRVVALDDRGTSTGLDLYRGMRDMKAADDFGEKGGCELAPMSTTTDLMVALEYSKSEFPFILKVRSSGFHDRGADISWLSAFPGEKEVLFPPLTYLKPTGRAEVVGQCTVVEVTPTLA